MKRAPCIAGRSTTCWKAHYEADPGVPLVVKNRWQYTERDEESELFQEATKAWSTSHAIITTRRLASVIRPMMSWTTFEAAWTSGPRATIDQNGWCSRLAQLWLMLRDWAGAAVGPV